MFDVGLLSDGEQNQMSTVGYPHVEIAGNGIPILAGTSTKVVEVALDRLAYHWDAEEIQRQHPHLSLGQIHSALAYYYDHQAEMDNEIDAQLKHIGQIKSSQGESTLRCKLRAMRPMRPQQ